MKTCDEMVNSLFQRREQYLAEQKIKRRNAVISTALYCCAFAAVAGIGVWIKGEVSRKPIPVDSSMTNPGSAAGSSDVATNSLNTPSPMFAPDLFESFKDFEEHEKKAKTNAVSFYYVPSSIPSGFELTQIAKRDNIYVMVTYSIPAAALSSKDAQEYAGLNSYDSSRLQTLICQLSLNTDGQSSLKDFIANGYEPMEYEGRTYYRWDEHAENDPEKRVIGYELAFLDDGNLIFLHLPAIDTFENMMKYADVEKVEIEGEPNNKPDLPIVWAEGEPVTDYYIEWNGKDIHSRLWDALEKDETNDNSLFAVSAYFGKNDGQFVYKGKTLTQYVEESGGKKLENLRQLLKLGDSLKYGEALYQSGTPDGEKWAKEYYDGIVSDFGEDFLAEYIVDGVFLKDKVLQDIPEAEKELETAQSEFLQACAAYRVHVYKGTLKKLESQGLNYELDENSGHLILYLTKEEFANLTLDNMSDWRFYHASKSEKVGLDPVDE